MEDMEMKYVTYVVGMISLVLIPWTASIANGKADDD